MLELFKKRGFRPLSGVWELTLRCNMRCQHCGSRAGASRGAELTADEMFSVADQLIALGNQKITLSGGEPLLRKEWVEVARRLRAGGVTVAMITNGYCFDERVLQQCIEVGLATVGFSVDGDESVHNTIRGLPDAYRRAMDALDLCAKHGFPAAVCTTIHTRNAHLLETMGNEFIGHGVAGWQLQLGFDYGNMSDHQDLLVDPADLATIIPGVAELKQRLASRICIAAADDIGYYTELEPLFRGRADAADGATSDEEDEEIDFWIGCRAGMEVIGIEANGNIKGCLSMQDERFVEGNVREQPLAEIWNREGAFAYTREFTPDNLGGFCRRCEYNEICRGGCSWNAYLHGRETGKMANRYCLHQVRQLAAETEAAG